jgi:glycerophosphoryl diester phosphodiesterase
MLPLLADALRAVRSAPLPLLRAWLLAEFVTDAALLSVASVAVNLIVAATGHYVIANDDLVGFFLSPKGIAVAAITAVISIVALAYARAASLLIAARALAPAPPVGYTATLLGLAGAAKRLPTLLRLAARQVGFAALQASPLLAALVAIVWLTVGNVDLYWLVISRPPRFWIGCAVAAPVALAALILLAWRYQQWSLALPLCTLERMSPAAAMRTSAERMRGRIIRVGLVRLVWCGAMLAIAAGLLALLREVAEAAFRREWGSLEWTVVAAGFTLLLAAGIGFLARSAIGAGDTMLLFALWKRDQAADGVVPLLERGGEIPAVARRLRWAVPFGAVGMAVGAFGGSLGVMELIDRPIRVEITAHRGAASDAPENTVAAVREALALGADRVEVDAMLAADGVPMVFHDTDLRRLTGDRRRIADLTSAELATFDVGLWFGPEFAGERIPTLEALLDAVTPADGGPLPPFNLELKGAAGTEAALAEAVVAAMARRGGRMDRTIVTSLSPADLTALRRLDPKRRIGIIVTATIGDLHRLDVDLYSVRAALITPGLVAAAHREGRQVHAWGVPDADRLATLLLHGIDGVITSDVAATRAEVDRLAAMSDLERLALAFRARLVR